MIARGFIKFQKKEPKSMNDIVHEYIREMKIASGLNERRIFAAWDAISGAAQYTVGKSVRGGVLYLSISSSVIRSQLYLRQEKLVERNNAFVEDNELFTESDRSCGYVRSIVFR